MSELEEAVIEYLKEMDNDVAPDYTMRRILRDRLKTVVGYAVSEPDRRPHSRACKFRAHPHGRACSPNCPTCHGKDEK